MFAADRPVSDADAPLTSDWFVFTGPPARERLWLVWSATPIADLAALVPRLTAGSLVTVPEAAAANVFEPFGPFSTRSRSRSGPASAGPFL